MSQEELNNSQDSNYVDPLNAAGNGEPAKKGKGNASIVGSTVAAMIIWRLFGLVGGLICYGGFWAVYAIARTKLPLAARIILCIVVALVFVGLLLAFIVVAATLQN